MTYVPPAPGIPGQRPTIDDLTTRLKALEDALSAGVGDLTQAELQRKLETTWQPDASLLEAGSLLAALGFRIVYGVVAGTGTVVAGSGYTVTRTAVGTYTVAFAPAFTSPPAVVATARGISPPLFARHGSPASAGSAQILTCDTSPANTDTEFHFIAIGPH